MNYSVRAMQHMLELAINTKIPYDLAHKQPFVCFRNWLQCLERLWFNFKICGIFTQLPVVFRPPFWYGTSIVKEKQLKVPARHAARSQLKTTGRKIEIIEINNKFYRSSELPAQIPQILRKILRICQLFKVLSQRPQDQRPNSNTFFG